jgi:hypothetical protein
MVRRFAPWLFNQLNLAMSTRLGIRMTEEQRQRLHDAMQEMIEDILADYGMRRVIKVSGLPASSSQQVQMLDQRFAPALVAWSRPGHAIPALPDSVADKGRTDTA